MDNARHPSSPSPTSPFLFHHSERPYKTNPLTPLLSSAADITNVDECFSTTTASNLQHPNHSPFGNDHHSLVGTHQQSSQHHHHHHHHQRHNEQCVIEHDSLTGVDDDDGMHNMLSGSSTSSTSTMPLLTESHSHHSFSRISLEEYSPLSLVEDALPISPTSLAACGSHHSFKSLNGLKVDNLGVDVGVHDHDDVNDARSMSPSLLSPSTSNNHNNLWSNSSTAITQNPALLNSTSTSFLLSNHHHPHHQLNSLIQQLEPQSLDEPPPLINQTGASLEFNTSNTHRPSSEPPPGSWLEVSDVGSKSVKSQASQNKPKHSNIKTQKTKTVPSLAASSSKSRKNRNRSNTVKQQRSSNGDNHKTGDQEPKDTQTATSSAGPKADVPAHCSKLHLQLNHHQKLKELQQRLFGNKTETKNGSLDGNENETNTTTANSKNDSTIVSEKTENATSNVGGIKEEADSSAANNKNTSSTMPAASQATNSQASASTSVSPLAQIKSRTRQTRNRKGRTDKGDTCNLSSSSQLASKMSAKVVTTETAEPDTTTKSSDCIKLADLLLNSSDSKSVSASVIATNTNSSVTSDTNDVNDNCDKRIQQIQLQVSPSLTVVTNGSGLMQPINIQQQQQLSNRTVVTSSGFTNQILCRPQTIVTTAGNQLKGIVSNNELLKGGDTMISNWSMLANTNGNNINQGTSNNNNGNATTTISNLPTIGAHQIAIQVICQDGTSLVLPVSSAAGINAAVSLTSQHQQLQAVLANNSSNQRNSNQILPLMSVSNIVAQQQHAANEGTSLSSSNTTAIWNNNNNNNNTNLSQASSGLAASSPTLAALLDAGSNQNNNNASNNGNLSGQNYISNNLLRKLVTGNSAKDLKRTELSLQQGTQLGLTNGGSLVTVCTPNNTSATTNNKSVCANAQQGEKRIKLENADIGNIQTTFTLIDSQALIVANSNDKIDKKQQTLAKSQLSGQPCTTTSVKTGTSEASGNKQNKMTSSTGNRQVDPTQPFRCEHCNSTFTRLGNFTRHKKIHTVPTKDGQRFKCDVCSKSFLQRCDLARHLHIHRGTEPHRCNICGKGYIRHSDLVTHQRFHNKEKPFGCPHCSKGFCQRGDLNRHLRSIHLQMKPILCPCCNRKFAKQETLLRHLNTAHRSKPGTTSGNAVIAELPPNYTLNQNDVRMNSMKNNKIRNQSPSPIHLGCGGLEVAGRSS